jgi:hypothetical protein
MITGKDFEGWLTAENPLKAMEAAMRQEEAMATALFQKEHRERRERIATAALAGLLANPDNLHDIEAAAIDACRHADALIAELDKKEEDKA